MKINIRNEEKRDYRKVEELARDVFWNLYIPGSVEHLIISKMRNHKDFIRELAFVIEVEDEIVGAIFYTHSKIITSTDKEFNTISFGPVFIAKEFQRIGLGKKLINHSMDVAKELGYKVIQILGYPYHYKTYGFEGGKKYGISMEDGKFYIALQILPLSEGVLEDISGYAVFSEVMEVSEKEAEEYDKTFPYKEKSYQKSQDEFSKTSIMYDEE